MANRKLVYIAELCDEFLRALPAECRFMEYDVLKKNINDSIMMTKPSNLDPCMRLSHSVRELHFVSLMSHFRACVRTSHAISMSLACLLIVCSCLFHRERDDDVLPVLVTSKNLIVRQLEEGIGASIIGTANTRRRNHQSRRLIWLFATTDRSRRQTGQLTALI